MSRMVIVAAVFLVMVSSGCSANPVDLATQFQDAINSQNIDSTLGLLADDAVFQVDGTQSRAGKAEIEDWLLTQVELSFRLEGAPTASESGAAFENCSISSDIWSFFEVDPMTATCELALNGGAITSFVVQFDENSKARLSDSPAPSSADMIGIWITRNYLTDSGDLYLHFFEQGIGRLADSPSDSVAAPDSDFEGANLKWNYEDFILTVQNEGQASEKYCQEQDVGTFLAKTHEGGGLKFTTINDSCSLRGVAMQLPPRWRPHAP